MFSISVSSFAPLSSFPTEDLKQEWGLAGPPPQSASGRAATCVSVDVCSLALVLLPPGGSSRPGGFSGGAAQ